MRSYGYEPYLNRYRMQIQRETALHAEVSSLMITQHTAECCGKKIIAAVPHAVNEAHAEYNERTDRKNPMKAAARLPQHAGKADGKRHRSAD